MVPLLLVLLTALVQGLTARPPTSACSELAPRKPVSAIASPNHPACIRVDVSSGEAVQVVATQHDDVALHVSGEGQDTVIDGFEFGRETLTISNPGHYRIEILPAGATPKNTHLTVPMSIITLPLQIAGEWQTAEISATESKKSGKETSIAASLKRWQNLGDSSAVGRTWLMLGDVFLRASDFVRSRDAYERGLEICRTVADVRCVAEAANNSGLAARQLGEFGDSLTRLQEAAKYWEQLSLPVNQGITYSNLGVLFSKIGDYEQAIGAYDRARTILKDRNPLAYARALNNLGLNYQSLAQYDKAELYFKQAMSVESKIKVPIDDQLRARLNLGRTLMLEGRLQAARANIEAVEQASASANDNTRAYILNNLGQTLWRLGLTEEAESRLKDALEVHQKTHDKRWEAIALHYLGVIAEKRGNIPDARRLLGQALQIRLDYGMRDEAADSFYELAQLEFAAGETQQAARLTQEAIPLLEMVRSRVPGAALRASFYARRRNLLDLLVTIAMREGNDHATVDGLVAAEIGRGRALLDLIAERQLSSPQPPELVARQARIRRSTDLLVKRLETEKINAGERENIKRQIEALIAQDEEVSARIHESIDDREPGAQPLTSVSELQRTVLSPHRAILEYQLGENVSHVWLIRDQQVEVFSLPSRAVIEQQVSATVALFGKVLERRRDPTRQAAYQKAMHRLSATLLGSIKAEELPTLVILVLDGDLNRVPFAALQLSNRQYLGIQHDLVMAPSSAFLMHGIRPRPTSEFPKSVLALYDPVFSIDDPRMPETLGKRKDIASLNLSRLPFHNELSVISHFVPRSRLDFLSGIDANAEALRSLRLEQYGILHLSTHAVINDQIPELSHIALSVIDRQGRPVSGFVFPYQLAALRMRGSVVVLSACDTALGKKVMGEGLIGFTSSLFSAGASELVLTLSQVDAEASSAFLSSTYSHVLGLKSTSMEHGMTLARQQFLKSGRWSDPYYWASFVIVGMPLSIQSERGGPQ